MTTVIASILVFTAVTVLLTLALQFAERHLVGAGEAHVVVNDQKTLEVPAGASLLTVLADNQIFVPSACGGGGTCGMCKVQILEGGGDILPTETTHVSRREAKQHVRLACQVKVREDMKIHVPDEIFSIRQFTGTVVSNDNVATFIKALNMVIDDGQQLEFKAGGYIQITVPPGVYPYKDFDIPDEYKPDWDRFDMWRFTARVDEPVFRAYSMANHPAEGNRVLLTVRIASPPPNKPNVPPGKCSSYIFSLRPGDKVHFSGPYGEFFIKDTDREMVYIGGGAGMAPMRSHIFHLFHTLKTKRKVSFFYGARSLRENFFEEDFKAIEREFPNFKYVVALSSPLPEDNWDGPVGFIHQVAYDMYLKDHEDPTEVEYYMCGPPMMIDAVEKMLYDLGVDEEMIAYDKF